MRGWRLESPDREEVASVLNTASNTVVADIQELSPTVQTLHWVAPPSYLGNRVSRWRRRGHGGANAVYSGDLMFKCRNFQNNCFMLLFILKTKASCIPPFKVI